MSKQLIFKPNPEELDYVMENIESWTDWCRDNLKRHIKNRRHKLVENISTRLLLIVAGCVIASISYLTPLFLIIVPAFLMGSLMIVVGTVSLWGIYLDERKTIRG